MTKYKSVRLVISFSAQPNSRRESGGYSNTWAYLMKVEPIPLFSLPYAPLIRESTRLLLEGYVTERVFQLSDGEVQP